MSKPYRHQFMTEYDIKLEKYIFNDDHIKKYHAAIKEIQYKQIQPTKRLANE